MSQNPLAHAIWTALSTTHSSLACQTGQALRYPAHVAPFVAVQGNTAAVFQDLYPLLTPGETVYLQGERPPQVSGLLWQGVIPCLQMIFPLEIPPPVPSQVPPIELLDCRHAAEMMNLIAIAYPGYFRLETCKMGRYFGVRDPSGDLIAMGGERLCFAIPNHTPWREISGLCSHPAHAGQGFGTAILCSILATHRAEGSRSWLWVVETNRKAVDLYLRLGFVIGDRSQLHRLQRRP